MYQMLNTNSKYLRWIDNTSAKKTAKYRTLICKQWDTKLFYFPLQIFPFSFSIVFFHILEMS